MKIDSRKCREIIEKLEDGYILGHQGELWFLWKTNTAKPGQPFRRPTKEFVNDKACKSLEKHGCLHKVHEINQCPEGISVIAYKIAK